MKLSPIFVGLAALALGACSTIPFKNGNSEIVAEQNKALGEWKAKADALERDVAALRAENATLTRSVESLKRQQNDAKQLIQAEKEKQAQLTALLAEQQQAEDVIVAPSPPKNPQSIIVAEADAAPLSPTAVPVETTPRLVEPSFAAVEAVFENEAGSSSITTTSVLFGAHIASYRKTDEAITNWRRLQRENPNLLGLLEPRVKKINVGNRGEFYRLIAGGFTSEQKALELCETLKKKKLYCAVTGFDGERLDIPAAG